MLLQFSVENFLSIKDRVTLSLVASKDDLLSENTINFNKIKVLKSAALYGPNASGKTNILKALSYIIYLIGNSHINQPGQKINIIPFRLDKTVEDRPSTFEIIFEIVGTKYIYGVSLDRNKVYKEYLYYYPHGRKRTIFIRDHENQNIYTFPVDENRQNVIKENTGENMLYLSRSANMNYERTSVVVKWFLNNIITMIQDSYLTDLSGYTKRICAENKTIKGEIMKRFVSKADRGIVDLTVKDIELREDFLKDLPQEIRDIVVEDIRREIETIHCGLDRNGERIKVAFRFEEESEGTRKIFKWSGPFLDAMVNGRLLLIDEFERSLHPLLVRYLIDTFNKSGFNNFGAQLIFATHSSYLLHPDILRRDQIWFTEKKADQSTDLRSLYEYRARKYENIEKGYLAGRYGAIPDLN